MLVGGSLTLDADADHGDPEALAILHDGCVDLSDLAERLDFIAPKVGKLLGYKVVKVDPNDPIAVSKAKAAIKDRHTRWAENRVDKTGAGDGTPVITVLRISELKRYLRLRYGDELPDDDAGRQDLVILLNHVAHNRTDPGGKMLGFGRRWAPSMAPNEAEALIAMILAKPRKYTPKRLGELLRLTEAERRQLCITTIRAFDATNQSMAEDAKRKDREYQKAKRDEKCSGRPRGRPKSEGVPAWVAAGASSRATFYRNLKAGNSETENESGASEQPSYAPDGIKVSPVQPPAVERGAPEARPAPKPIDMDDTGDDDVDGMIQIEVDGESCDLGAWPERPVGPRISKVVLTTLTLLKGRQEWPNLSR